MWRIVFQVSHGDAQDSSAATDCPTDTGIETGMRTANYNRLRRLLERSKRWLTCIYAEEVRAALTALAKSATQLGFRGAGNIIELMCMWEA